FTLNQIQYSIDSNSGTSIAIPLDFEGPQPSAYGTEAAKSVPHELFGNSCDTRFGSNYNFHRISLSPHSNGTHTECIGHISKSRQFVSPTLSETLIPACLISVTPIDPGCTKDSYDPPMEPPDKIISEEALRSKLQLIDPNFYRAIVIRTLPNDESKKHRRYLDHPPIYFSLEAMSYVSSLNPNHLLIDLPSVDRPKDDGKISCHHIFWNIARGSTTTSESSNYNRTIT
ncbi:MAG: cyclase family protein, partial [Bdellovibrionales bacterium]|nr:cyclase family protein [Bdellovibrionales bacterium]